MFKQKPFIVAEKEDSADPLCRPFVLFSDVMSTSFKEVPIFKLVELEQGLSINMITLNFCAIHTYP